MSEFTDKIISDLEEIRANLPEVTETIFGQKVITKLNEPSLNEAKYCTRWYFADHKNNLSTQVKYELEHMDYLKDYINDLDENENLKEALNMAIDGYVGALKILEYYKIKEELHGEG